MASVRERDGRWTLIFKDRRGRWRHQVSRARTKTEALKMAAELERTEERIRLGFDLAPPDPITFGEVAERWRQEVASTKGNKKSIESRLKYLMPEFGALRLTEITSEHIERYINKLPRSAWTKKHLLQQLSQIFNAAIRWRLLLGENPAASVPPIAVMRRPTRFLQAPEVPRMLAGLPAKWRNFFAVAVYAGLRRGEICGLRWDDVDFERRLIHVQHSFDGPTKTGKDRHVPIAQELMPFLLDQGRHRQRNAKHVFTTVDGTMIQRGQMFVPILHMALRNADIVIGYDFICRRSRRKDALKCAFVTERRMDKTPSPCPLCGMSLWIRPIAKPLRFHDLRSTFATHLRERCKDIEVVQKALVAGDHRADLLGRP
jgi:integrase